MLGVISQAKVSVDKQAGKRVKCEHKTLFDYWKNKEKARNLIFLLFSVMFACV